MLLRLTLHFVPLFRREAPYASRLAAKSKHFVLAFCFQKKKESGSSLGLISLPKAGIFCIFFGFTLKLAFRNYILQNSSERQI